MISQPWVQRPDWEQHDARLRQLAEQPIQLPHLDRMVEEMPQGEGIFSVIGPRQVGKSTLLRLIARRWLASHPPAALALVEGDAIDSWRELLSVISEFLKTLPKKRLRGCVLIDEITSVADWHRAIKLLADRGELAGIMLLYTGSSATSLRKCGELFPGRRGRQKKTDFELYPVSWRDVADRLTLREYFVVGGFPWSINEYLRLGVIPEYVGEISWSWLKGEFLKRGRSEMLLRHILRSLVRRMGTGASQHTLAQEMGITSNETARQYLELLSDCFAIRQVPWMDPQKHLLSARKNPKYYPIDPLLVHLFENPISLGGLEPKQDLEPGLAGAIAEAVVCEELARHHDAPAYWSGKREIDFVPSFIEVKFQNRVIPQEFAWFEKVFQKGRRLLILTKNDAFTLGRIKAMPLEAWLRLMPKEQAVL